MLSEKTQQWIAHLKYMTTLERNPLNAVDRVLKSEIYDPLNHDSPEQILKHIEEARASRSPLSDIGPPIPHAEQLLRLFLTELADRIRKGDSKPVLRIDPDLKLPAEAERQIAMLINALSLTLTPKEALDFLINNEFSQWKMDKPYRDTIQFIRFALRSDVHLSKSIAARYSEQQVRDYLRDVAWKLEDLLQALT